MKVQPHHLSANDRIPNNKALPLLYYVQAFPAEENLKEKFSKHFEENAWGGSWVNGVYNYHHYHSNAHEVLGVAAGKAVIIFGGPGGPEVEVQAGDLVVIPSGVGHCCQQASDNFQVVGAYPAGQEAYDLCTEKDDPDEKKKNIAKVPLPQTDPLFGANGPLMEQWKEASKA